MKKFGISFIIMLVFMFISSLAFAGNYGTVYDVGANYKAAGNNLAIGDAHAKVFAPKGNTGDFGGNNYAVDYAWSGQKVKSSAWGLSNGKVKTVAFGMAGQYSDAAVDLGNGNWAVGGEFTSADYFVVGKGYCYNASRGKAQVIGGTVAGAASFERGNTTIGMAGAATGGYGTAKACSRRAIVGPRTHVYATGEVYHASYAERGNGQAWTYGSAMYTSNTYGGHKVSGYGFAATGGISTVKTKPNGAIIAKAASLSISGASGKARTKAVTGGGVYISNLP